jgi:hypothetical protein
MSTFGWLDYSEHDRQKALDVIDLFREQDTRDELGLATIRDGFADQFFPGTSTIQTRARYFFFVPWLYQSLERKKVSSAEVAKRARREELALIEVLLASDDWDGTIGRVARLKLKRLPSSIYWQGLARLGIRFYPGSIDQYHRSLDRFYVSGRTERTDDNDLVDRARATNWHPRLPSPPGDFPTVASLTLTPEEAAFLRDQIVFRAKDSVFRYFVDDHLPLDDIDFTWNHPSASALPAGLQTQLQHARYFSELMYGASVLYNLMLAQLSANDELTASYDAVFRDWIDSVAASRDEYSVWDRVEFWKTVMRTGARVTAATRMFVDAWLTSAINGSVSSSDGSSARTLIHSRERQLKRGQARLDSPRALELWSGAAGMQRLDYRWRISRRMLADIHDGGQRAQFDA